MSQHVEDESVFEKIKNGYDLVVIQDNADCVSSDDMRQKCKEACHTLVTAIRESGAMPYIYVRPPYGYEKFGYEPLENCDQFDLLFNEISKEEGTVNIWVNRAFACAIRNTDIPLWGTDNAHTSKQGAYLVVCTAFATIFNTSAAALGCGEINLEEAKVLQAIADEVAQVKD